MQTSELQTTSIKGNVWKIVNTDPASSLFEKLCHNRGLFEEEKIEDFFAPFSDVQYFDPYLLKNMREAVDRIKYGVAKKEKIIVYGDYDVDGMTSTAIMFKALEYLGAKVSYRLPDRIKDGYGLNKRYVDECVELGVSLIITVDCGSSNSEEVKYAKQQDVEVIVVDHHTVPDSFPTNETIFINPKQKDCDYPFPDVCGAMLAYKLSCALLVDIHEVANSHEIIQELLDLAVIGTVADCMPLVSENRAILKKGIPRLKDSKNIGLQELYGTARINKDQINTHTIGFAIGPRLNAAGRIATPYTGLQLLLGKKENAPLLDELNKRRQDMVEEFLREAESQIEEDIRNEEKVLAVASESWHIGVVGLIAGKLAQKYSRPAVAMQKKDDVYVGSARSVSGINIMELMNSCKDFFTHYGGHKQAAGFSLKVECIDDFVNEFKNFGKEFIDDSMIQSVLEIECELSPQEILFDTIDVIEKFSPFGIGNKEPLFCIRGVSVLDTRTIGKDAKHLKLQLDIEGVTLEAVAFHFAEFEKNLQQGQEIDLAGYLELNEWNGKRNIQLRVEDVLLRDGSL